MAVYDEPLDSMNLFARDLRTVARVNEDEMASLLALAEHGDDGARNRLVEGLQPLVLTIAKRLQRRCQFLELLDLAQEGSCGLLHAIQEQHKRPATMSFGRFAFYWVRNAMLQAIYQHERTIRLPAHVLCRLRTLTAAQATLLGSLGREATVAELASELAFSESNVISLLLLQAEHITNLDTPISSESNLALADVLPAPDGADTSVPLALSVELGLAIIQLSPREQEVVTLHYGFGQEESYTTRQIADILGIPQRLVQDIDQRVRMRLRTLLAHWQVPQISTAA